MNSVGVFIHPQAIVASTAIGTGTRIWAFAHICQGAVIGINCNLGDGCYIEGGSRIGNNVTIKNGVMIWEGITIADAAFIGPAVIFTNDRRPRSPRFELVRQRYASKDWLSLTHIGRGAALGANATIGPGVTIGEFAMIGAGAVVTSNVPAYTLVYGNPARPHGYVCACGHRLKFVNGQTTCSNCCLQYRMTPEGVITGG